MRPLQRRVSRCWRWHELPGRCQRGHSVEEAIGEEKTSPTAELVQGPCGADPLTARSSQHPALVHQLVYGFF